MTLKLGDLKANPKNPRKISPEKLEMLKKALEEFGDLGGIVYNKTSKQLIGGHQRSSLHKDAEIVIERTHKKPTRTGTVAEGHVMINGERFTYREVKWDSAKEKAANVAANKGAGEWDRSLLSEMLLELDTLNIDMELTMFDAKELEDMIVPVTHVPPSGDPDHVPEPPKTPITKPGDIWSLGMHRIMCGDSTMIDQVEALMENDKAELVFTDPPYGVGYQSNMRVKSKKFEVIDGDETFLSEWVNCLPVVSTGWVFVWTSWKVLQKWIEITAPIGELSNMIIWDKGGGGIGDLKKTFASDYEIALVFNRGAEITGKRLGSVWSIGKDGSSEYLHPTQKPVALGQMAIENCITAKGIILDLFGGSGSTLIAAELTGRPSRVMELSPAYCDVIINRWEIYTGKKACLLQN